MALTEAAELTRLGSAFLPFALPDTDETEIAEVAAAIRSGWVTTGPKTRQFEAEFSTFVGARHAIAVNSCTAAMHLALEAIGLQAGDVVFTTPLTFAATAEVVRYFGAVPLFADVDSVTLNLDPNCLREAVAKVNQLQAASGASGRLRAILPVHLAGLACDLDAIHVIAREDDLVVIEDAAHALPTRYRGALIGASPATAQPDALPRAHSFTCFSFYATKTLTTGEGGMICTDSDEWAERCRIMSLHGISRDAWKRYTAEGSWYYEIVAPGFKYNLTDIAAAMGLAQLRKLERMWARRQWIAGQYSAAFRELPELQVPAEANAGDQHAWHLYMLRLHLDQLRIDRTQFIDELKARNIGTSVHFIPLHLHPYYRKTFGYRPDDFPVAYREYLRLISLPIYSKMTNEDVQDVIDAVSDVVENHRR